RMYRPAPRPLTLVFPTRALPLKDDSASASRSADGAAAAYRGRPAMHGRLEITKRNPVATKACDLIMPSFSGLRPRAPRLLRACHERPGRCRAAEQRDEPAAIARQILPAAAFPHFPTRKLFVDMP